VRVQEAERAFPADEVVPLASRRSLGVDVSYGDKTLKCKALDHYDFSDVDICLMSAGSPVSKEWSPKIAAAGAVVIDNSSCWRYDADVPLIVPEINAHAARRHQARSIGIAGGVSANSRLREELAVHGAAREIPTFVPSLALSTDNAAMIAAAGYLKWKRGEVSGLDLNADVELRLGAGSGTKSKRHR